MKLQPRYGTRTLLATVTLLAVLMAAGVKLRNDEMERQRLVSASAQGVAQFNSYAGHSETLSLPFSRWIGSTLAAGDSETQSILVDFHKSATDDEIQHILSLFPELQIVHFNCTVANPKNIGFLSRLPKLNSIQINDGRIDISTMNAIGALPQRPEVTFQNIHLDDEFLRDAARSGINLHYVYSPSSSVSDEGLKSVSKIESLVSLCIKDCDVSNDGLRVLDGHPSLRYVYLENCPVDDSCIGTLTSLPDLYQLSLKGTKVTDEGVRSLLPIVASLGELDIRNTSVSQDTVNKLNAKCKTGALKVR